MTLQNLNISNLCYFRISFAQTKTAFGKEKILKISIEVGCQVSHAGRHSEEPAFLCQHCACIRFPKAHITMVAMDDVICLGRRSRRASFAFSSYFSRLLSANSTQYKSFRVELKISNSKWTYPGKSRAFISFSDAISCCLIHLQHRIRKKLET